MNSRTLLLLSLALPAPAAFAADFTVDRLDDPAPNGCTPGHCSLREAVLAANATVGQDRILLPAGTMVLSIPGANEDAGLTGDLDILDAVEIAGVGSALSTVRQNADDRMLHIDDAHFVRLQGFALRGARVSEGQGGSAIRAVETTMEMIDMHIVDNVGQFNGGMNFVGAANLQPFPRLTIRDSRFENNVGGGNRALGISASGQPNGPYAVIEDTSFVGNMSGDEALYGFGGSIYVTAFSSEESHQIVARRVTMTSNIARASGGAITLVHNGGPGPELLLEDSELCGNRSDISGGALYVGGRAVVRRTTFCSNSVSSTDPLADGGGAIAIRSSLSGVALTLERSTFVNNSAPRGGALWMRQGNVTARGTTITPPFAVPVGTQATVLYHAGDNTDALMLRDNLWHGSCAFEEADVEPAQSRYNLEAPGNTCRFTRTPGALGNQVSVATSMLKLGSLADNGGPTRTRLPASDSVAIDAAEPGSCQLLDQRSYLGGDSRCDAGAVERSASVDGFGVFGDGFE